MDQADPFYDNQDHGKNALIIHKHGIDSLMSKSI